MSPQKRKHQDREKPRERTPHVTLSVQAHEADIIRGPKAAVLAEELEIRYDKESGTLHHVGSALVMMSVGEKELWVDRYSSICITLSSNN
jgi:hypothetical protein